MKSACKPEMRLPPNKSSPTAPIIFTCTAEVIEEICFLFGRDRAIRAHATAWFAPLPPFPVLNALAVSVSPPDGTLGVVVTRSVFSDPMMVMVLVAIVSAVLVVVVLEI